MFVKSGNIQVLIWNVSRNLKINELTILNINEFNTVQFRPVFWSIDSNLTSHGLFLLLAPPKIPILDYISAYHELHYKLHSQMLNFHPASPIHCPEISEPVDIVYTWVNGTDPDFLQQVQEFKAKEGKPKDGELVSRRFHGKTG